MEKNIKIPESYLEYSNESFDGRRLHKFQLEIRDVLKQDEDCLIVKAPTGAGKTYAFGLPTAEEKSYLRRPKTIILAPTNSLVQEIFENIEKEFDKISVEKWTGPSMKKWKKKYMEIPDSLANSDIIVSNPDIISLIISSLYVRNSHLDRTDRLRQWTDLFRKGSLMIIDEFHSYSEQEIAKIMSFIILAKETGNSHMKFILSSATPNNKIESLMKKLGITYRSVNSKPMSRIDNLHKFRPLKGPINIVFTDVNIIDSVFSEVPANGKTLFLCDHKIDAEKIIEKLNSLNAKDIDERTSFENKNKFRKKIENATYVVATNAAELGLNLDVDISHIEPGLFLENFRQRFGRIARNGKSGILYVHTTSEKVSQIKEGLMDEDQLMIELENLFNKKEFYLEKTLNALSAYIFMVYKSTPNEFIKEFIIKSKHKGDLFDSFSIFDENIEKLTGVNLRTSSNMKVLCWLKDWWIEYLRSFGYFRGMSRNVEVELPREDHKRTEEDIAWIKRNTVYDREKSGLFLVRQYLDTPNRVKLTFKSPIYKDNVVLEQVDLNDHSRLVKKWKEAFDDLFENRINEFVPSEILQKLQKYLGSVLKPMTQDLLKPIDVEEVENDLFL
jgi:CRISPR-associated helicase Cas3